jgi:hypothetical protein
MGRMLLLLETIQCMLEQVLMDMRRERSHWCFCGLLVLEQGHQNMGWNYGRSPRHGRGRGKTGKELLTFEMFQQGRLRKHGSSSEGNVGRRTTPGEWLIHPLGILQEIRSRIRRSHDGGNLGCSKRSNRLQGSFPSHFCKGGIYK